MKAFCFRNNHGLVLRGRDISGKLVVGSISNRYQSDDLCYLGCIPWFQQPGPSQDQEMIESSLQVDSICYLKTIQGAKGYSFPVSKELKTYGLFY